MTGYIELVENRSGVDEPWHNRLKGDNHEITWNSESFSERSSARMSILQLGRMFSPVDKATVNDHELWVWLDDDELGVKLTIPIRETIEGATDE